MNLLDGFSPRIWSKELLTWSDDFLWVALTYGRVGYLHAPHPKPRFWKRLTLQ